MLYRSARYIFP